MLTDFNQPLFAPDAGLPDPNSPDLESRPLTLKKVAVDGLMRSFKMNVTSSGRAELKRLKLALRIDDAAGPLVLSDEERQLICEEVQLQFPAEVAERAQELLRL